MKDGSHCERLFFCSFFNSGFCYFRYKQIWCFSDECHWAWNSLLYSKNYILHSSSSPKKLPPNQTHYFLRLEYISFFFVLRYLNIIHYSLPPANFVIPQTKSNRCAWWLSSSSPSNMLNTKFSRQCFYFHFPPWGIFFGYKFKRKQNS